MFSVTDYYSEAVWGFIESTDVSWKSPSGEHEISREMLWSDSWKS